MGLNTKDVYVILGTSASVTLPEPAAELVAAGEVAGGATAFAITALTVVSTAPSSGDIQFTGTANAPSTALTLAAAPATTGGLLLCRIVPAGAAPASV